jgi:2-furoate---CoA ligase
MERRISMNLGDYFEAAVQRTPGVLALVDNQVRWTYADLAQEAERVAHGLWLIGLRPGDRVMVLLRNRREHVVIFWACQQLGLVYVPVSYHFAPNDIEYCIEDAEPEVLFFDDASEATITMLSERRKLPGAVYSIEGKDQPPCKSYNRLRMQEKPQRPHIVPHDEAIAVMLYSSGATGRPKGIPRSHTNEISSTIAHIIQNAYSFGESTVAISSFYHTMGLRMLLAMALLSGKLVLAPEEHTRAYGTLIEQEGISCLYAFPSVYHDLLAVADEYDFRSIKKIAYAGAPMSQTLIGQCIEHFVGDRFVNHFGSTEIYTYTACSWLARKPMCAGKAGIHTQIRIVVPMNAATVTPDEQVGPGEVGELIVRLNSPEAFRGYWNRPDLTAKAIRDGWFFTGDLVRMDDEGDLWVMGRVDDMVISSGEKVYPTEVETVLRTHPKIKEVAVLGIPDKRVGQLLTAFVVPADPSLTIEELDQFCVTNPDLADFKRPAKFILLDALPRHGGKLLRRELVRLC